MDFQKQLEEAQEKIKFLEKRLDVTEKEKNDLIKIIGIFDGQIFRCKRNSAKDYVFTFNEGAIAEKYNIQTEQVKGKKVQDVYGSRIFMEFSSAFEKAFNGQNICHEGLEYDGGTFSTHIYPLRTGNDGRVEEIFGAIRDVTEIELSNRENKILLDLLNSIIEHNPYSIQILNAEGYHIRENKAYVDLFKAIPDKSWSILKDPIIKESGFYELLVQVMNGNVIATPPIWYNAHNVDPQYEDNPIFIGSVIFPVFLSDGNLENIVLMHENITSRVKAEEELIVQKERAEESDRLKSAFLANMSHEIRTPMNGILGFAELLKNQKLTGKEQRKFIDIIEKSGERMLNIINDLINISIVESGQMETNFSETNINEQLDFLYNFFKLEAKQNDVDLNVYSTLSTSKAIIYTDREKVYAILTNLIKNAIKFTKSGSVDFGYEMKGSMIEFYVKDTGIGIQKEKQKAIFERFVQADVSLSRGYEGAGLGLSISKAYVEILGGTIWLESQESVGSQFYFTIPINAKSKVELPLNKNLELEMVDTTRRVSILIAEDDETTLVYYAQILKDSHFKLFIANTGKEAVEICQNNKDIDLVLMDIKMPVMDGFTAAKQIREFRPNLAIIAQTAFALEAEKEKYGKHFDDYITKPIKFDELMQKVNKILIKNNV